MKQGHLHPSTLTLREIISYFEELGFSVYESPEVDDEWHNFDALNVPADHPARDEQDTFYLTDRRVLRTHTSNNQARAGKEIQPPIKIVVPGKCYRNEATDETHETTFFQLDALYIDKDVKVGNLFWALEMILKKLYGENVEWRMRPHHYPFVEPGFDVDIKRGEKLASSGVEKLASSGVEKLASSGVERWMEVLGSGMVHPKVLKNMGLDPNVYSGFAFGLGPDRMMMQRHKIKDIRQLWQSDLRFLRQF
jgi:phenylalanyl-tRNA synthetase alpha chain